MAIKNLKPTTIVEVMFDGKVIETEFADGKFYSKVPLTESSSKYVDELDEADSFYTTDPIEMIKQVNQMSIRYLREIPNQYDDENDQSDNV